MSDSKDILSEDELEKLRKEIEELTVESEHMENNPSLMAADQPNGQMLMNMIDETNMEPLSIDENGSYVKIAEDNMSAWLYLAPPGEGKEHYTLEEITEFLEKKGITKGYHHSNLVAMIKKKIYDREILIAAGLPAIEGHDGYFEYKFDPEQYRTPKILADGRVDYTSMSTLQNVSKGDVVAIYHHAEMGQDGYDIAGKPLQAKKVREIPALRGQAVSNEEDPDIYIATKDGKIEFKNGRVDIQTLHQIDGDVTLITGKVEFYGDVVIQGNVEAGVVIRAGRNIEIKGIVEAVDLFAGGDIILSRGIQGAQKARIIAKGNVLADFIEHTVVNAGGNVQANTILNSRVMADGTITLTGKKGAIIGGYSHALLGITATEIGNTAEIRTIVHGGCEKEVFQKALAVRARATELSGKLRSTSEEIMVLRKKRALEQENMTLMLENRLKGLEQSLIAFKTELEETILERDTLEKEVIAGETATIVVNGNIYRGTVVSLGQMQMPIEYTTCYMKYFQQRGMIESTVIAYS